MTLKRAITTTKQRLIKKAQVKGIYENFGQTETRKLRDKYDCSDFGDTQQRQDAKLVNAFEDWAMNYCG